MTTFVNTDLFIELDELFDELFSEEAACEAIGHGEIPTHPDADEPGEWYVGLNCIHCSLNLVLLICNTYRNTIVTHKPSSIYRCRRCGLLSTKKDFITTMVRRS